MTYIQQWEQMRDKVRNLEQERQTQLILAPHNAYGFKLNINHPLIRPKWDAFKSAKGLGQYGMTDDLRRSLRRRCLPANICRNAWSRSSSTLVQWSTSSSVWLTPCGAGSGLMGTQEHWTAAQYQEYIRQRAKGGNKYHAVKAQADGRTYDSRSECKRAKELQLLERHGLVRNLRSRSLMS